MNCLILESLLRSARYEQVCPSAKPQKLVRYSEKDPESIDYWETYQHAVIIQIIIGNQSEF